MDDPSFGAVADRVRSGRKTWCEYSAGGSPSAGVLVAAAMSARFDDSTLVYVTAHLDEADDAVEELNCLGIEALRFPALEILPGETNVSPELLGERVGVARRLLARQSGVNGSAAGTLVIAAAIPALMQGMPDPARLDEVCLDLEAGRDARGPGSLLSWLEAAGYDRVESIESPGEFAVRGGIIDVFPAAGSMTELTTDDTVPIRLDFFGDDLESIREIDVDTMAGDRMVRTARIIGAAPEKLLSDQGAVGLWSLLPDESVVILHELMEINEQGRGYYERAVSGAGIFGTPEVLRNLSACRLLHADQHPVGASDPDSTFHLPFAALPPFHEEAKQAVQELAELAHNGTVLVTCNNDAERERFIELLHENVESAPPTVEAVVTFVHRGYRWDPTHGEPATGAGSLSVVPYHELLHRYHMRRRTRRLRAGRAIDTFLDLKSGDYVVHRDHGIAKFVAFGAKDLKSRKRRGRHSDDGSGDEQEYLTLEFDGGAKLHVPATRVDLVQRYVGGFQGRPPLSKLGGKKWTRQKEKVSEAVRDLAAEMLRLQAVRDHLPGIRYPHDTEWQHQFEAEFPYEETDDQLGSLAEIKKDMLCDRPMDRLLCGDVGFGKTELAIRAAFKAVEFGKQVAILVPTTVLAEQHGRTFRQRFADYPFRIEVLSRFQTDSQVAKALDQLAIGRVDIVIGTHRLLSRDVKFADLGLVVIDEEQRFGVEHKQHLLQFRMTADVLTLSATPIPRTLHMSMLGLRDISSLTTAPLDRRAVVTEVIPYNELRIKRAIERELAREGQVFFVHNRVYNIQTVADRIQSMVPDARIVVGHGQMADRELERVMVKFIRGQADILVSTTIIESGIDIPNANTMFIHDAHRFGLADLHQLRGRVGRYKHRAYCYLLLPQDATVTAIATKRLKAIEEYSMLGAGFRIAMRDLEIRGAGNLLGAEQSGHIAAVGYEMYCRLLEEAVHDMKNERVVSPIDTEVEIGITGSIPRGYIPSELRRLEAYRRISQARTVGEIETIGRELGDAYGEPPAETDRLLQLAEVRIRAAEMDIKSVTVHAPDVVFTSTQPEAVARAFDTATGSVRVIEPRFPGNPMEIYFRPPAQYLEAATLLAILRQRLKAEE